VFDFVGLFLVDILVRNLSLPPQTKNPKYGPENYNYVAVPMSIFSSTGELFFARVLHEIGIRQAVVGINFGHTEWPLY